MKILTKKASLVCVHRGVVRLKTSQTLVRVDGEIVLVEPDPEGCDIDRCPNRTLTGIRPCLNSLKVRSGYSTFVRIDRHRMCLESVSGLTDGTPPGEAEYLVRDPGQTLVSSVS